MVAAQTQRSSALMQSMTIDSAAIRLTDAILGHDEPDLEQALKAAANIGVLHIAYVPLCSQKREDASLGSDELHAGKAAQLIAKPSGAQMIVLWIICWATRLVRGRDLKDRDVCLLHEAQEPCTVASGSTLRRCVAALRRRASRRASGDGTSSAPFAASRLAFDDLKAHFPVSLKE
jgi:hypothetical protein